MITSLWTDQRPQRIPSPSAMQSRKKPHHLAGRTGPDANATKPAAEKRTARIVFRATTAEEKRYNDAAGKAGKPLAEWARDILNEHSRH